MHAAVLQRHEHDQRVTSGNFGATNIDSNYASITEQSGIKAGDEGLH
ncbi:hypothetical protein [Pseudomonas syringae]